MDDIVRLLLESTNSLSYHPIPLFVDYSNNVQSRAIEFELPWSNHPLNPFPSTRASWGYHFLFKFTRYTGFDGCGLCISKVRMVYVCVFCLFRGLVLSCLVWVMMMMGRFSRMKWDWGKPFRYLRSSNYSQFYVIILILILILILKTIHLHYHLPSFIIVSWLLFQPVWHTTGNMRWNDGVPRFLISCLFYAEKVICRYIGSREEKEKAQKHGLIHPNSFSILITTYIFHFLKNNWNKCLDIQSLNDNPWRTIVISSTPSNTIFLFLMKVIALKIPLLNGLL